MLFYSENMVLLNLSFNINYVNFTFSQDFSDNSVDTSDYLNVYNYFIIRWIASFWNRAIWLAETRHVANPFEPVVTG